MRLHIPTGLTAILSSYQQVFIALNSLDTETDALISPSFRGRLEPAHRALVALSEQYHGLKLAWTQALNQRDAELGRLRRLVRDTWLMLRRRDRREGHAGLLILHYQMPVLAPPHASPALWLQHARNLVHGEQRALAAGHTPMAYPSAAELAEGLARTELAEADYQLLSLGLKDAETELRQQQRLASHLLRRLAARLRESQYDREPAQIHALLRCFGYRLKPTPSDDPETLAELAQGQAQSDNLTQPAQEPTAGRSLPPHRSEEQTAPELGMRVATSTPPADGNREDPGRGRTKTPKLDRLRQWALRKAS